MQPSSLYADQLQARLANRYKNPAYIADRLFPKVEVSQDTGLYFQFDQYLSYKIVDDSMSARASANEIDPLIGKLPFSLDTHAQATWIDEKEVKQAGSLLDIRSIKTDYLMNSMMLARENRVQSILRNTASYASSANYVTLSGTSMWDNAASNPKQAVLAAKASTLMDLNVMWMGRAVWDALQQHPMVIAAIQYSSGAVDTRSILARYFQVDEILVGEAFGATNKEGQTLATSRLWGKDAGLIHVPRQASADNMEPSFGIWLVSNQGAGAGNLFRVFRSPPVPTRGTGAGAEYVKAEGTYGLLIQAPSLGFLFKNAVS